MLDHFNFLKFIGLYSDSSHVEKIFSLKVVYTCIHVFVICSRTLSCIYSFSNFFIQSPNIYLLSTYLLGAADPAVNKTKEGPGLLN